MVTRRCACGRPARYTDAIHKYTRHLCHHCWVEEWADQLLILPEPKDTK